MPVLSFHPLFDAEHCQTYIHTLRWKEPPLQCPPQLPTPEGVRAGRDDPVCGPRPSYGTQSQKGSVDQMLGPF
jgi:hypothetical protein